MKKGRKNERAVRLTVATWLSTSFGATASPNRIASQRYQRLIGAPIQTAPHAKMYPVRSASHRAAAGAADARGAPGRCSSRCASASPEAAITLALAAFVRSGCVCSARVYAAHMTGNGAMRDAFLKAASDRTALAL